ncbi:MAG: DciA family protein [Cyanobacteria bacterium J06621_8]
MYQHSLEQILSQLEQQPNWEKFREHRQLLKCWHNTVNPRTAQYTRPLHITRRVLWIATTSAARAQELSFQRYALLKRLNQQLPVPLKDLRFTTSGWAESTSQPREQTSFFRISSKNKSDKSRTQSVTGIANPEQEPNPSTRGSAKDAAQKWLKTLSQANSSQTNCPSCNALTPKEELERWNLCCHCAAQKWAQEYRTPSFTESQ